MADASPTSALGFDNFYQGTLTGDITASSTDILIDTIPTSSEGFLVIEPDSTTAREIIYYNSKTALKVVCPSAALGRGQGGTSAGAHSTGATIICAPIAEMFEALQSGLGMNAKAIKYNTPQGFLQNGQISRSVSSNNLTIALKTLAGNDPSASDPVIVRIGNSIRTITSALSVTKNAGTNWMNLGAAETATLDQDVFVYLGYNATDGVVIGFSRLPGMRVYSDFSATTTNEGYCAISTITNAAATDEYECIGRVNVTISATASFNWSVPATSIIINRPIDETRWMSVTTTLVGGAALGNGTVTYSEYKVLRDRVCKYRYKAVGGSTSAFSGSTNGHVTPFAVASAGNLIPIGTFMFFDSSGSGFYIGNVGSESTVNNSRWLIYSASGAQAVYASITNVVPADWDTSDVVAMEGEFKIA